MLYFDSLDGLIFVIDSSNRERINEAKAALDLVMSDQRIQKTNVLVLANKQDMKDIMTAEEIRDMLELDRLRVKN